MFETFDVDLIFSRVLNTGRTKPGIIICEHFLSQFTKTVQGRNQDLSLAKQKYEILTGHENRCKKLYKMTVYQAKTL